MTEPVRNSSEFLLHRKPSGFACANTKRKRLRPYEYLWREYDVQMGMSLYKFKRLIKELKKKWLK